MKVAEEEKFLVYVTAEKNEAAKEEEAIMALDTM